jgi:hypothetical protein
MFQPLSFSPDFYVEDSRVEAEAACHKTADMTCYIGFYAILVPEASHARYYSPVPG